MVEIFMTTAMLVGFCAGVCIVLTLIAIMTGKINV